MGKWNGDKHDEEKNVVGCGQKSWVVGNSLV